MRALPERDLGDGMFVSCQHAWNDISPLPTLMIRKNEQAINAHSLKCRHSFAVVLFANQAGR